MIHKSQRIILRVGFASQSNSTSFIVFNANDKSIYYFFVPPIVTLPSYDAFFLEKSSLKNSKNSVLPLDILNFISKNLKVISKTNRISDLKLKQYAAKTLSFFFLFCFIFSVRYIMIE